MTNKVIANFFSNSLSEYDKHMMESGHYKAQAKLIKEFKSHIKEPILDLACGTGYIGKLLSLEHKDITLNDLSPEMLTVAKKKLGDCVNYINQDSETIEVDTKFETLICCNLMYYIKDRSLTLEYWSDALSDNGKLIVIEEFPFLLTSKNEEFNGQLDELIDPMSSLELLKLFLDKSYKLIALSDVSIDEYHNLYGYVFIK